MTRDEIVEVMAEASINGAFGSSAWGATTDHVRNAARKDVANVLTALEKAGYSIEPGWQTMESAPRDGEWFLAVGGGLGVEIDIASYNKSVGAWNTTRYTLDDHDNEPDGYNRPTHWRPLPALPEQKE
ncbi:hypothetical protein [Aestuariivirga sp.]|uniref:hypothetical protein n=1 Tax=Aestuariivirga sp. TaxID=2650926 RepID=UPI0039E31A95